LVALLALLVLARPDPVLGGQKQIILGVQAEPTAVLSYYIWMRSKPNEYGSSLNEFAQRMGYTAAGVKNDIFNNSRVLRFETDARSKDPEKEIDNGIGASEKDWLAPDGHILRQIMVVTTPKNGERTVEAIYGTKTIEVSVTENGVEKTTTVYPEDGCQTFFDRFKPMVVDGKVVLNSKTFSILDPVTLGIVPCKAEVAGRFSGMILQTKMNGTTFDITIGGKRQRAYLADGIDLVKIDITQDSYFQIDSLPTRMMPNHGGGKPRA